MVSLYARVIYLFLQAVLTLCGLVVCFTAYKRLQRKDLLTCPLLACLLAIVALESFILCPMRIIMNILIHQEVILNASVWIWLEQGLTVTTRNMLCILCVFLCICRIRKLKNVFQMTQCTVKKKQSILLYLCLAILVMTSVALVVVDWKNKKVTINSFVYSSTSLESTETLNLSLRPDIPYIALVMMSTLFLIFGYAYCMIWVQRMLAKVEPSLKISHQGLKISDLKLRNDVSEDKHVSLKPRECSSVVPLQVLAKKNRNTDSSVWTTGVKFSSSGSHSSTKSKQSLASTSAQVSTAVKQFLEPMPSKIRRTSQQYNYDEVTVESAADGSSSARPSCMTMSTRLSTLTSCSEATGPNTELPFQDPTPGTSGSRPLGMEVRYQGWCSCESTPNHSPNVRRKSSQKPTSPVTNKTGAKRASNTTLLTVNFQVETELDNDDLDNLHVRRLRNSTITISSEFSIEGPSSSNAPHKTCRSESLQVGVDTEHVVSPTDISMQRYKHSFQGGSPYFNPLYVKAKFPYISRVRARCALYILLHILFLLPCIVSMLTLSSGPTRAAKNAYVITAPLTSFYISLTLLLTLGEKR